MRAEPRAQGARGGGEADRGLRCQASAGRDASQEGDSDTGESGADGEDAGNLAGDLVGETGDRAGETGAEAGREVAGETAGRFTRRGAGNERLQPDSERLQPDVEQRQADGERLQKVLARAGFGSRRSCEELIASGRVTVNGSVAELGRRVDVERDAVVVDEFPVGVLPGLVYYVLNKPAGVVTTASDPQGRPVVVDLVPSSPRVFPVGRLDAGTEGLLLLTNDGDLAQRLAHPSHGVEKEYLAEVAGVPSAGAIRRLREGVELADGLTAPAKVSAVSPTVLRITIHEGRNRQVRRMCEEVGHPVLRLVRTRIGPLTDRRLAPGEWRELEIEEVRALSRSGTGA